jgi:hypothetical protein
MTGTTTLELPRHASCAGGIRAQVAGEDTITATSSGGYGLRFVDRLADAWGVEPDGSRVWLTLAS